MEIRKEIKNYFNDIIFSPSGLRKRIKNAPKEYIEYCESILKNEPEWLKISYVVIGICKDIQLKKCKTCGKKLTYLQLRKDGYCSKSCVFKNKDIRKIIEEKSLKTNLEKYGCKNPMQSQVIKDKIKETCLEKYGTESALASKIVRDKIANTNIEKYGCENVFGAKEIQDKIKEVNLKRYGEETYVNSQDFKNKSKLSFQKHYGVSSPFESKIIQEKAANTILEKYNVKNIFLLKENIDKCKNTKKDKSWNLILEWKDFIIPLFTKEEYEGHTNLEYRWKCVKCGNEFSQRIYTTHFNLEYACLPRCLNCYPFYGRISQREKELAEFCKQFFPNLKENDRTIIKPLEVDVLIDDIKLAVEFNGTYWHSISAGTPFGYHLNKLNLCESKGYHLIQIWENDWDNNKDEIKSKLEKVFNNEKEIFKDDTLILDREWYEKKDIPGYILKEIKEPEVIERENCLCENSGYLVYIKEK